MLWLSALCFSSHCNCFPLLGKQHPLGMCPLFSVRFLLFWARTLMSKTLSRSVSWKKKHFIHFSVCPPCLFLSIINSSFFFFYKTMKYKLMHYALAIGCVPCMHPIAFSFRFFCLFLNNSDVDRLFDSYSVRIKWLACFAYTYNPYTYVYIYIYIYMMKQYIIK